MGSSPFSGIMSEWYWLSSENMTIAVRVDNGTIMITPPIVKVFKYQPINNLIRWMKKQPGFTYVKIS